MRFLIICVFTFICAGCIEPYEFTIYNNQPALVVEGLISDRSFRKTLDYPSDGRYFTVKLSYTSDVTNLKSKEVSGASVLLISDNGSQWSYTADSSMPGLYILKNKHFKAEPDVKYRLKIILNDGDEYESSWESLPEVKPAIGDIHFKEVEKEVYKVAAGEKVVYKVKGITTHIDMLPTNSSDSAAYYRWTVTPAWIYIAPLARSSEYDYLCTATNKEYLKDYFLHVDNIGGGYSKELFFMEVIRNEKIFEDFSVLVTQQTMSGDFYSFWKELKEQASNGAIYDKPPYNLHTNIYSLGRDKRVSGYFSVVAEQATRWYFNRHDLSYFVEDVLKPDCLIEYGLPGEPPAAECTSCLAYTKGKASLGVPSWWRER